MAGDLTERRIAELERSEWVGSPAFRGGLPKVPSRTALPTAGAHLSYRVLVVQGTPDLHYICLRDSGGTWGWVNLSVVATLIGVDFLVGTASSDLSGEIVVGTTPGGELGGTWASPTVDASHSGSTHAATQAAAEATASAALSTHAGAADPHTGYRLESADHSHASTGLQAGQLDHGLALTGLSDDDHTQYYKKAGDTLSGTVSGTPTWASSQAITLSTAAQPNITSVGVLTSLNVGSGATFNAPLLGVRGARGAGSGFGFTNMLAIEDSTSMADGVGGAVVFHGSYTGTTVTPLAQIAGVKNNGTDNNWDGRLSMWVRQHNGAMLELIRAFPTGLRFPILPGFSASDKYLIIDASGNVHISAVGPAS